MDSTLSEECRRVFVLFCPIIIQTISLPCSLPLQGAEGTQPLLCLLISSYILLGFPFLISLSFLLTVVAVWQIFFCVLVYIFIWNFHVCIIWAHTASLSIKRNVFFF